MSVLESELVKYIAKWSNKKVLKNLVLNGFGFLFFLIMTSLNMVNVIPCLYFLTVFTTVFYVKYIVLSKAEKRFAVYRNVWNRSFGDNSFDSYFKLYDMFDIFFETKYQEAAKQKQINDAYYDTFHFKYTNSTKEYNRSTKKWYPNSAAINAMHAFGYSTLDNLSESELKRRFKQLLKKVHPDNGGTDEATLKLVENYEILKQWC